MIRKHSMKLLSVTLILMISACTSTTKIVTPKIKHKSHAELVQEQPNCIPHIDAVQNAFMVGANDKVQQNACLDVMKCYRDTWKFWEGKYRELDAKVNVLNE